MKSRVQKDTNGLNTIARKIIQCRRYAKRILTAGLSCVMTVSLLAGCGGGMSPDSSEFTDGDGQISDAADAPAMGRYLEKVTDLTTILSGYREKIFALEDGKMVILQMADCMLVSEDNGVTWTEEGSPWLSQLTAYNNIEDYAIGADGTVGIVYSQLPAEDETTDGEENTFQESNDVFYRRTNVRIIRPDGTQLEASLPGQDEVDNYPRHVWISNDGRPCVGTYGAE